MSNEITVFTESDAGALAPEFQALVDAGDVPEDLGGGIGGSYGILTTRGSKFRVKYQGTEVPLLNEKEEPVGSVEAVILKANPYLTKQYYESGYSEGDTSAPDCFSVDGKVPSEAVENPQHTRCDTCPQNRFGSKITPAGVKVKACQDNKKLAIVPLSDLENRAYGGPMLFRVPASALKDLLAFSNKMSANGYPYFAVAVRIGLDIDVSYPKPTFKAMRPLTSEEAQVVMEMRESDQTERLLADFQDIKAGDADGILKEPEGVFEQDPQPQPAARPAAPPPPPVARKPAPAVAAKPAPAPAAKPVAPKAAAPAAKPAVAAKAPVTPPPPAARPAAKPAVKAAPAPAPEPEPETAEAGEPGEGAISMEEDIANILAGLNAPSA